MSGVDERMREPTASIRYALQQTADPTRAAGQRAYMKSAMPFLGVRLPEARRIVRRSAKDIEDAELLRGTARRPWDDAGFRALRRVGAAGDGASI